MVKKLVLLAAALMLMGATACKSNEGGAREYRPGQGWKAVK